MIQIKGGWDVLDWWKGPDCDEVCERLNAMRMNHETFNPTGDRLFRALQMVPFDQVRVAIIGQDPYPDPLHATGIAFDVDPDCPIASIPPTLKCIFKELTNDLHCPYPKTGSLANWCYEGVLLWNSIPSCRAFSSLSHDWPEYHSLTKEIIQKLSHRGQTVFVFLGNVAKRFLGDVEPGEDVLALSHPSPRASRAAKHPFLDSRRVYHAPFVGSRIFSIVNDKLVHQGQEPIEWRL